jgi:hypothetical protein
MVKNSGNNLAERLKIQEKALQGLADKLEKREAEFDENMQDVLEELKALKVFLSRAIPDFKKQYPEIRKKLKAA